MEIHLYNNTIIEIKNDNVLVSYQDTQDRSVIKTIPLTLHDFIETVKSSSVKIDTPIFSTSTFKYSLEGDYETISLFSPPSRVNLKLRSGGIIYEYENACFPSFGMDITFNKGRDSMSDSTIYMLKDKYSPLELEKNFTKYPMLFPNVYDGTGRICWNSVLNNIVIKKSNAGILLDIFKTSMFNHDLFSVSLNKISSVIPQITTIQDYFQYLTTVDTYPDCLYF